MNKRTVNDNFHTVDIIELIFEEPLLHEIQIFYDNNEVHLKQHIEDFLEPFLFLKKKIILKCQLKKKKRKKVVT